MTNGGPPEHPTLQSLAWKVPLVAKPETVAVLLATKSPSNSWKSSFAALPVKLAVLIFIGSAPAFRNAPSKSSKPKRRAAIEERRQDFAKWLIIRVFLLDGFTPVLKAEITDDSLGSCEERSEEHTSELQSRFG